MSGRSNIMVARAVYQIAVVTVLASLFWVGVGIYQAYMKPSEVAIEPEILEQLNPAIDQAVIQQLTERGSIKIEE